MGEEKRNEIVSILTKINNCKSYSQLAEYNNELVKILKTLPNFNSDLYMPISLAIQLIDQKRNSINQGRQFIINIALAALGICIAIWNLIMGLR
jgi:hypothetical protein